VRTVDELAGLDARRRQLHAHLAHAQVVPSDHLVAHARPEGARRMKLVLERGVEVAQRLAEADDEETILMLL
jgi:hypothetical protein